MPPPHTTTILASGPSRFAEPATTRERWRGGVYLSFTIAVVTLVILAIVFDQFAATGVLLVAFLSFFLAYLLAPAMERLRHVGARGSRPLSRGLTVLVIYGAIATATFPLWAFAGEKLNAAIGRMRVLVPEHTARFVNQLHAAEGWHEGIGLPMAFNGPLGAISRSVTGNVENEARKLADELVHIKGLVPWLSTVPVAAFLLLTRWGRFRQSTSRMLPTPHLRWRGDEFLRDLNVLLAAYTRAQTLSALSVGFLCWIAFAALRLPYPGTLALAAGCLEMLPLAGPLITAVVATSMSPDRALSILAVLGGLRLLQDYVIYPRLISRALHLHPLAVVLAIWAGAALGGLVGVCLAVPVVGTLQVTRRHWREYRDIEALVATAGMGDSPNA